MLKISEMAKLANTTRRTLIFYDEQGVFSPAKKSATGYRYYDYQQLYDLMFILGLRHLGLSLEEIKKVKVQSNPATPALLARARNRVNAKIKELTQIETVIDRKLAQATPPTKRDLYQPMIKTCLPQYFWCSNASVSCTEEEIAQLFADFYQQLDALTVVDTSTSGYLTDLPVSDPEGYADASFRIIKEAIPQRGKVFIPTLAKETGDYACILVENNVVGINHGLTVLNAFCQSQQLATQDHLWQINTGEPLAEHGASKYGWLEYALIGD